MSRINLISVAKLAFGVFGLLVSLCVWAAGGLNSQKIGSVSFQSKGFFSMPKKARNGITQTTALSPMRLCC